MLRGIKRGQALNTGIVSAVFDIIEPAAAAFRVRGDAQERDKYIQSCRGQHGDHQDTVQSILLKVELLRGMGDAFKPNKRPW